jgi:hypothetical protein
VLGSHLNHGGEGLFRILKLGLATNANDARVIRTAGDHPIEGFGGDSLEEE